MFLLELKKTIIPFINISKREEPNAVTIAKMPTKHSLVVKLMALAEEKVHKEKQWFSTG